MPSPPLSATLLHTTITFVCMRPPKLCFRARARWATQHCPFCYACWGRPWPGPAVDHHRRGASGLPRSGALLHWRVQGMPPPDPTVKRCSFGAPLSPRRPLCSPPASGSASISSPLQWRRCASTQRWFEVMQYGSTPTLLRWRPMSTPRTPCPTS